MDIKGSKPFFFTEMKANSAFSSQTRGWISRPKSCYIKDCCHCLCYRLLSVLKSIKRLNSIYLSGLAELLTWYVLDALPGESWSYWRIFWFKLWTKAHSFLYCTLIGISLRWFNSSWIVNKSWKTFKLKATGSVILYDISTLELPFEQTQKKKKPTER